MTDETRKTLVEMDKTNYGKAVKDYLREQKEKLGDISTATTEDLKARQLTVSFIKDFLRVIEGGKPEVIKGNSYE